jgi:aspartyl-tRNA(Asn)/glutamyl-tRNA(Gln) amidotransferase subunit C
MTISIKDLKNLNQLAYLKTNPDEEAKLAEEVNSILNFVEQLKQIDTSKTEPLFHPMDMLQPLREDIISETDCLNQLDEIAPLFENSFYLVPQVIEGAK